MMYCEFRISGHLSPQWREWLGGMTVTNLEDHEALIAGEVVDQAALVGLINRLHALNIHLFTLTCTCSSTRSLAAADTDA